jgi:opacity protein-like surface antigen
MMSRSLSRPSCLARLALSAPFAAAIALAATSASAQSNDPNCPPGSWFCADTNAQPAAPAGQPVAPAPAPKAEPKTLEPLPAPEAQKPPPPAVIYQPAPPVVVYQPPPPVVVHEAPPPYYYHPRPADSYPNRREWGLNLRLEGAVMGHKAAQGSGMGGAGFGFRYKPVPAFGLELDTDFVGGHDYQGMKRQETELALNALVFVNPKSKAQVYFLAGFGWSWAHVETDAPFMSNGYGSADYRYFGGQIGAGLEFRVSKHFALNADVRGFIRGRTDDLAQYQPEFTDPSTGRTTNTSGGGLITGGCTFYW